ncbi:hypothetical protein ASZ78_006723, partial [Callipepla squamata]
DETRQRVKFTDDRVCKSHLLDCCPHDILAGTRMDLGECTKIHDLALRADYEIASKERDLFFELDAMDHLESFIAECDRRTELAKKRLAETQEEISAEVSAKAEKVHELNEDIGKLLAKAEQLGAEGNVDESQKILMEVEKVRAKKKEAEEEYRNSMPASSFQQQKLRVCEVCSAYLGLHDNDRRLADHFGGKLHLGFIQIREKLDQLRVILSALNILLLVLKAFSTHVKLIQNSLQNAYVSPEISDVRTPETSNAENSGRKAREEKPGSFEAEGRKGTRGENGQASDANENHVIVEPGVIDRGGLDREIEIVEDHGLGTGGEDARGQHPASGGSLAPGLEIDTDVTGAAPAATAEVTDGGPETGVRNTKRNSPSQDLEVLGCEAYCNGLLCTSDLLGIDLQERSHETERGKRRALLRGGMRAQMANLVPRDQKREKLARSELKRSVLHCK